MELFSLAWRYLLEHQTTLFPIPLPGHLLALLFILGLLGAGGLHHLLGYTYGFYRVGGRASALLAIPSLLVLLVSLQALLAAYVLTTSSLQMVRGALHHPAARVSIQPIGARLLAPAFQRMREEDGQSLELDRFALRSALLTFSAEELEERFQAQLQEARGGLPPKGTTAASSTAGRGGPSPELLVLTLNWLAGAYNHWSPVVPAPAQPEGSGPAPDVGARQNRPESEDSGAGERAPELDLEKKGAAEEGPQAKTPDAQSKGMERAGPEANALKGTEGTTAAEPEAPPKKDSGETPEQPIPLPTRYILGLVAEIPGDALLPRESWEYVAGSRFLERVMEPMIVWQVRYLAIMLVVLVFAANLLVFFTLRQFRRWLTRS